MKKLTALVRELKRQRDHIAQELQRLNNALSALNGLNHSAGRGNTGLKRRISAAGRRRIAAAARARWAKIKSAKKKAA